MDQNLIMDVGMHEGNDTEFYLKKGFNVVGIEADPLLVEKAERRFADYIKEGRLKILNVAINTYNGIATFYTNRNHSDWGTLSKEFVDRNEKIYYSNHEEVKVNCVKFENILKEYGIPYYLKVDIEGYDILCLEAFLAIDKKPKFVSIEPNQMSFKESCKELSLLWRSGYRGFKIINQALNYKIKCPSTPLEGNFVEHEFTGLSSGLFGEETPGQWLSVNKIMKKYKKILKMQSRFGKEGGWNGKYRNTILHKVYKVYISKTKREPLGWYDFHAKFMG